MKVYCVYWKKGRETGVCDYKQECPKGSRKKVVVRIYRVTRRSDWTIDCRLDREKKWLYPVFGGTPFKKRPGDRFEDITGQYLWDEMVSYEAWGGEKKGKKYLDL